MLPAMLVAQTTGAKYESSKIGSKGTMTDLRDGNIYQTITFSHGQTWMAENLNHDVIGSWCYNNDCNTYGHYYTWEMANKICPPGWRLPSNADFEQLLVNSEDRSEAYQYLMDSGKSNFNPRLGGAYWPMTDEFLGVEEDSTFWSATAYGSEGAWYLLSSSGSRKAGITTGGILYGRSCRCLQD